MDLEIEISKEVERLENLGYQVTEVSERAVHLEKHAMPSKLKITVWVFVSVLIPIVGIFFLISPARAVYFFRGHKYQASIQVVDGEVETT